MLDIGCRIPNAGYQMPDAGYQIPDAGCQVPDTGCRMPDVRYRMPDKAQLSSPKSRCRVMHFYFPLPHPDRLELICAGQHPGLPLLHWPDHPATGVSSKGG